MADRSDPAPLPGPLRAALGVVATVADTLRAGAGRPEGLTDRVLELPVLAVSTALHFSLRAQQHYAALTVRGDELLTQLRGGASDEPPPWAKFDDDDVPTPADTAPRADEPPPAAAKPSNAKANPTKPAKPRTSANRKPAKNTGAKPGSAARNGKPSAFDLVGDEPTIEELGGNEGGSNGRAGTDGSVRPAGGDLP